MFILEEYNPKIENIPDEKYIAADAISWFPNNGYQYTTHN